MTQPSPLIVAVAVTHAEIRCPCCSSSNPADFTLLEPTVHCSDVKGVTCEGSLVVSEAPDEVTLFWPGAQIAPAWLFCRCGTDFPLPAGVHIHRGGAAERCYTPDPHRWPASLASLPIPGARRGTPTATSPAVTPATPEAA